MNALAPAAEALGWPGSTVGGVRLLGTTVTAVVADDGGLTGVLVPVDESWRQALSAARGFLAFTPAALVMDAGDAPSDLCLLECGYADVGVVVLGTLGPEVAVPARTPRRSRRSLSLPLPS